jgi:hypothetical protein
MISFRSSGLMKRRETGGAPAKLFPFMGGLAIYAVMLRLL